MGGNDPIKNILVKWSNTLFEPHHPIVQAGEAAISMTAEQKNSFAKPTTTSEETPNAVEWIKSMMPVTLQNEEETTALIAEVEEETTDPIDALMTWEPTLPKLEDPVVPKSEVD